MNYLSLFNGISCGNLAINRAGLPITNYFSSEIDTYANKITMKNFPNTIQLGSVLDVKAIDLPKIDVLIGGSPCQGFSFAGKQLNFQDPRSKLFFEFVRLLKECQPKYFLLENVKMKQGYQDFISDYLECEPIEINSSLVSAQNRKRLYWTNIPVTFLPKDKNIFLKDIIFPDAEIPCLHNIYGGFNETKPRLFFDKSPTIRTSAGGGHIPSLIHSEKALAYMDRVTANGNNHCEYGHNSNIKNPKSQCITANFYKGVPYNVLVTEKLIRKFHPIECERLQTLPDNYTLCDGVSDTQRYKAIGNGWTVDVIAHIFSFIKNQANA